MKCARVQLQERIRVNYKDHTHEKPRRYCQKRMVDPNHDEDPRWVDVYERFHCNSPQLDSKDYFEEDCLQKDQEENGICLSVQTLKFEGNILKCQRPRTCFKYKSSNKGVKHRLFVKQPINEQEQLDDRSSQLTYYIYDDYAKYLNDQSRPCSAKSSYYYGVSGNTTENKCVQVNSPTCNKKKSKKSHIKQKTTKINIQKETKNEISNNNNYINEAKVVYQNTGKRKSLTISRAQSPETIQVIRVDVVCNYVNNSVLSDYEEMKKNNNIDNINEKMEKVSIKNTHFANKYLLTNTVKTLDENVSGGKVTLLCKTFRLSDRSKVVDKKLCTLKDIIKTKNNSKKIYKTIEV